VEEREQERANERESNPAIDQYDTSGRLGLTCNNEWWLQERNTRVPVIAKGCGHKADKTNPLCLTSAKSFSLSYINRYISKNAFCKSHLSSKIRYIVWESKTTSGQCFKRFFCGPKIIYIEYICESFTLVYI
jgi:hypothetical protein